MESILLIILLLIILFVIGLIFAFYWMWHKSHIKKTKRLKDIRHPRLVAYIHRAKKHGMSKKQIKKELKKEGWPDNIINQYL